MSGVQSLHPETSGLTIAIPPLAEQVFLISRNLNNAFAAADSCLKAGALSIELRDHLIKELAAKIRFFRTINGGSFSKVPREVQRSCGKASNRRLADPCAVCTLKRNKPEAWPVMALFSSTCWSPALNKP